MKASELRLGNYVEMTGVKIHLNHPEKLAYILEKGMDSPCEPIPLTKEWLLNFGGHSINSRNGFCTRLGILLISQVVDSWKVSIDTTSVRYIKYVHELQNGYHWLTGEELTIKETV